MDARDARIAELEAALAARDARIAQLEAQVAQLEKQVAQLLEQLNRNSRNSSNPPSSDSPKEREGRHGKGKGGGKKQGGQPGHKGSFRDLVPPELVDHLIHQFPTHCEGCHIPLPETQHPTPRRFQTFESPENKQTITEFQQHGVECPCCHEVTWPAHDTLPLSPFGPRLSAVVALMTGVYHLSRRSTETLLQDLLGVKVSLGAVSAIESRVSEAVKLAVAEAWAKVEGGEVKHADGTTWYKKATLCALWTVATTAATVFKIVTDGTRETLEKLFGGRGGILVSGRATALKFWAMKDRQICWAHLLRKFIAFSEHGGAVGSMGRELLDYVGIMFAYWDDLRCQRITREEFRAHMAPLREQVEAALERAAASGLARLAGSCADILEHRLALWTFVDVAGVDPTNNHAERELRAFVLWRKRSFGTQSERGNLFAKRLMTVVHTARKQNKNVLGFLTACCTAAVEHDTPPSLFAPAA